MDIEDYLQDAISMVDSWDLPEEEFSQAVNQQARLIAGMGLELSTDTGGWRVTNSYRKSADYLPWKARP
jgi:hypothetical protein